MIGLRLQITLARTTESQSRQSARRLSVAHKIHHTIATKSERGKSTEMCMHRNKEPSCVDAIENPSFRIDNLLVALKRDITHIALEQQ